MQIYKQDNTFILSNDEITYSFSIEKERYLRHRYFGKRINASTNINQPYFFDRGFCSNPFPDERDFSLDTLFQEYPDMNQGDFRSPAYIIQTEDGCRVTRFFYKEYEILRGMFMICNNCTSFSESNIILMRQFIVILIKDH